VGGQKNWIEMSGGDLTAGSPEKNRSRILREGGMEAGYESNTAWGKVGIS